MHPPRRLLSVEAGVRARRARVHAVGCVSRHETHNAGRGFWSHFGAASALTRKERALAARIVVSICAICLQ